MTAVIESPQDSTNKYEHDDKLRVFYLDRVVHSPVHYLGDYGFISGTIAEEGEPLDILVLGGHPVLPGCVYKARPVGLFDMLDSDTHDEKIVAYAVGESIESLMTRAIERWERDNASAAPLY